MADISKCEGVDCSIKEKCYRYTATASEYRQSYMMPPKKGKDCEYYWDNKQRKLYESTTKTKTR